MSKIGPIKWQRFEKFLFSVGCSFVREKGDHRIYWRDGLKRPVLFSRDPDVPIFVIRNNLRILGISVEEYLTILQQV